MSEENWSTESAEMAAAMRPGNLLPWIVGGAVALVAIIIAVVGFRRASEFEERLPAAQHELEAARTQLTAATAERDRLTRELSDAQQQLVACTSRTATPIAAARALPAAASAPTKHAPPAKRSRRHR